LLVHTASCKRPSNRILQQCEVLKGNTWKLGFLARNKSEVSEKAISVSMFLLPNAMFQKNLLTKSGRGKATPSESRYDVSPLV